MTAKAPIVAAIDLGTNSFNMVVASVNSRGMLQVQNRLKEMVRLGSGGGDMKHIEDDAIERGMATLKRCVDLAKSEKAVVRAVATSAVREADNQDIFIKRAKKEIGINIEVISGTEEGRLIYDGVINALPVDNQKALIIDIGGGSTETIIGQDGNLDFVASVKLGAIRLTHKFFENGLSSRRTVEDCRDFIIGEWAPTFKRLNEIGFDIVVGTSGTILNLAAMSMAAKDIRIPEILNGLVVSGEDILPVINTIATTYTAEERAKLPGMDPERTDIILSGALILEQAIINLDIKKIHISTYALREGIVFDTVKKFEHIKEFKNLDNLRYRTIQNLAKQYGVNIEHAEHVKMLALKMFDALEPIHSFGVKEREILEAASYLHDVGYLISHDQHHKHSYYILSHCVMPGFTNNEAELIANVARYHRKSHPKKKHENFNSLSTEDKDTVCLLSSLLRIAEGIDRRQMQAVKDITIYVKNDSVNITLHPASHDYSPDIELWGANRRKPMLEETIAKAVNFTIEQSQMQFF